MNEGRSGTRFTTGAGRVALGTGAAGLGASAVAGYLSPDQFFRSWLVGFNWILGVILGSMALLMLHHLVGGRWGHLVRRPLEAAARTLPLAVVLFIPLLLGMDRLYPWTGTNAADPLLAEKSPYLNPGFQIARAAIYFSAWLLWAWLLCRWSRRLDRTGDPALARRLQRFSAAGLVVYALTITFASVDWLMSLSPDWYSTVFGMIVMTGQVLSGIAFVILVVVGFARHTVLQNVVTSRHLHDLGNLLLTFVLLWAYVSFSQYLVIWSGDLPEEIPFYLRRTGTGWQLVALAVVVFHFAVPFAVLLSRRLKRTMRTLAAIAAGLLLMRWVDLYWTVAPTFEDAPSIHWLDLTVPVGIAGIWIWFFLVEVARQPLLPVYDAARKGVASWNLKART